MTMNEQAPAVTVRRGRPADTPAILDLLRRALGWRETDPDVDLFHWKHVANRFGPSPQWVAEDANRVVGFRTFMRWEFLDSGRLVRAVRAVDTATDPAYQGRGIFTQLTTRALAELADEGVDVVFNTPNDQSRPGYLKMGWQVVGQLPVAVRPRLGRSVARLARARTPADLWSVPTGAGEAAAAVLTDDAELVDLLHAPARGLATRRDAAYFTWRYGFAPLHYRVLPLGRHVGDGFIIFRLRRRGPAVEAAVCELLEPPGRRKRGTVRRLLAATGADYAVALTAAHRPLGMLPLPGQGPLLTCRPLRFPAVPSAPDWKLSLGDVELF